MIKKIILIILIVATTTFIADYYGIIDIPFYKEKPKILDARDDFLYKSQKQIDSTLK